MHEDEPRLSPGEIAYHDFAHASDGLDELEVRTFLGLVADVVSAARDRELRLEERLVELEAEVGDARTSTGSEPTRGSRAPDPRARELFARLRAERETTAAQPESVTDKAAPATPVAKLPPPPMATPAVVVVESEVESESEPEDDGEPGVEPTADDVVRAGRAEVLEPLLSELVRLAKRLLQDEQNLLLDAARRARARVEPDRLLPDAVEHRDTWVELLTPAVDAAYSGGRAAVGRSRQASDPSERVRNDLAAALIAPLRERLSATLASVIAEGPYESSAELHRELASAVSARYREWRTTDLELRLGDALAAAYARGSFDGSPSGAHLRWIVDAGQRCPDCEDNSLEPTVKGQSFPTGQPHPPAHPGCRCLLVVVEPDAVSGATDI